jgi:3-isopropylmalate/(R)-2-methylmalate dehydratase small subunit
MEKLDRLTGIAATMPVENINTDAIIPVSWIVNMGRDLGHGLFGNLRYDGAGNENPNFVLNIPPFREARILLVGPNFGCGSSREEAVWALLGFGIRCVIAPSFGDIFYENSFKNGVLPVVLDQKSVDILAKELASSPKPLLTADLVNCTVGVPGGTTMTFAIDSTRRQMLLEGTDEIDQTLARSAEIDAFHAADRGRRPWIYRSS